MSLASGWRASRHQLHGIRNGSSKLSAGDIFKLCGNYLHHHQNKTRVYCCKARCASVGAGIIGLPEISSAASAGVGALAPLKRLLIDGRRRRSPPRRGRRNVSEARIVNRLMMARGLTLSATSSCVISEAVNAYGLRIAGDDKF